jgi:MFS family permease
VLLAVENAPPGKRALYGMFPQLGAPIGFLLSGGIFLGLTRFLTDAQFFSFGWRLPFLTSSVLVLLGLYVRLTITETPVFAAAQKAHQPEGVPILAVVGRYWRETMAGVLVCLATFVLFYLMTVFALSWGTGPLHYNRGQFLILQLFGMLFFGVGIPVSAWLAEKGRKPVMIAVTVAIGIFGLVLGPLFQGSMAQVMVMLALGLTLMGMTYGPLGTIVSELFPTRVRYTGSSLAFSMGGILGASATPYVATKLAKGYGLSYVGYYLTAAAVLTLVGLLMIRETRDEDLTVAPAIGD